MNGTAHRGDDLRVMHGTGMRWGLLALALSLAITAGSPAAAEEAERPLALRSTGTFRSWTIEYGDENGTETTIWQARAPFQVTARFHPNAELVLSGASLMNRYEPERGDDISVNGLVDGAAQLFVRLAGDRILLRGGAFFPHGAEADSAELAVARLVGHPLLGFRSRQLSRGMDGHAGIALAQPLSPNIRIGAGAGYTLRGSYTLIEDGGTYEPASEMIVTAGLEFGGAATHAGYIRFDGAWRTFGTDRQDDRDLLQEGDQLEIQVSTRVGDESGPMAEANARLVHKDDDEVLSAGEGEPNEYSPGLWTRAQVSISDRWTRWLRAGLSGEWTRMSDDDRTLYDGVAWGAGPYFGFDFGPRFNLTIGGGVLGGELDASEESPGADLKGLQTSLTLTWRGAS